VSLLLLQALLRDSFKCVVTGGTDWQSRSLVEESESALVETEVAHLFSQTAEENGTVRSSRSTSSVSDSVQEYMATALAFLKMFGLDKQVEMLQQEGVHSLRNVFTLSTFLHHRFDRFEFWLEYVPDQVNPAPNSH
jgi:hypothetical protein